ncbi:glycosyltransferase family 4 protein [Sphingomonas panacisoli]|nr:glycosyltransferase family 1 protein [Sphingomonas panacisoli]
MTGDATVTIAGAGRPLRVALFSGNYNYVKDGCNQALNMLAAYLQDNHGAEVRVYSPTTATPAFDPVGTLVYAPAVTIPGRSEFKLAIGLSPRLRRDLAAFAPDIVHVSAPDFLGVAAQKWAKARGIPVVASLHTRFETYFSYYGLSLFRGWAERHLARFYGRSDYVLVPNRPILDEMASARSDGHVRLWGRGVDRTRFDPARRDMPWRREVGIGDNEIAVLFFGRLVLEKGVDDFAAIVRRLQEQGIPARALVVGEGPAHARLAKALPDAVFTGHLTGDELGRAVASADVMVNPSVTEAFGNVVLEAMAAGLPVVSADAPSARALIEPGATGVLCPPGDIGAYADMVRQLIALPAETRKLSMAARAATAAFTWSAALAAVVAVYAEAVDPFV